MGESLLLNFEATKNKQKTHSRNDDIPEKKTTIGNRLCLSETVLFYFTFSFLAGYEKQLLAPSYQFRVSIICRNNQPNIF